MRIRRFLIHLVFITHAHGWEVPPLTSCFGSYPNVLNITEEDRGTFLPVVIYPRKEGEIIVNDKRNASDLATEDEIFRAKLRNSFWKRLSRKIRQGNKGSSKWNIGKYDENRLEMYSSEIFDESNAVENYSGSRTIHLGVDLGAPVSTKVYAFTDGVVHSVGYNDCHGDYGYVVIIEHHLSSNRKIWALYGHLDRTTLRKKKPGTAIKKGQMIGRIGDSHENGGWREPHCHFQLSIRPPETHDMPGAASMQDRPRALLHYPDPRLVLGIIH